MTLSALEPGELDGELEELELLEDEDSELLELEEELLLFLGLWSLGSESDFLFLSGSRFGGSITCV